MDEGSRFSEVLNVMGILNLTPDSFSDGGRFLDPDAAIRRAEEMTMQGADVIDVGGESTRPGAQPVTAAEQISRTAAVIKTIAGLGVPISIDTRDSKVARAAIDNGATMINDVSGGTHDPAMLALMAESGCELILMHMRGTPETMDDETNYQDVVLDVKAELKDRTVAAVETGVVAEKIWLDPGLGFAKTADQSRDLLANVGSLRSLGHRLLVGPSRKRFIGEEHLHGTAAAVAWCAWSGIDMVRVHDVAVMRRVADMISDLRTRAR